MSFDFSTIVSINQKIELPVLKEKKIELFIKREDLLHPHISGNKYRKLKYNLLKAKEDSQHTLLTFGGAFSNHISAVAAAGKEYGFQTIGIIRGEELESKTTANPTLQFAQACGMHLHFVSRSNYRNKNTLEFIHKLDQKFGDFYLIPEGGTNELAIKGCEEILTEKDAYFDIVCVAVGTGGTVSGIINCLKPRQQVLGFPALKGSFLKNDIRKFANNNQWELIDYYHFGGYGKVCEELIVFINGFKKETGVSLDPVYTGKMLFGVLDLIKRGYFKEKTKILAVHTGGLQGITGMNNFLKRKKLPLIHL
ncbi:1-aminocyclopropane-1-carboxylate deaminase/D-cysteine desulfhydrase [Leptobacterium sp. I13]|uniref:1-aminocyclopropane-1-carboxylate deaminase/D-cysteine desulfhydrase n=1 Tax=Leptobacterium meishanense TaxID=3128904 RepID=UPI0030EB3896